MSMLTRICDNLIWNWTFRIIEFVILKIRRIGIIVNIVLLAQLKFQGFATLKIKTMAKPKQRSTLLLTFPVVS